MVTNSMIRIGLLGTAKVAEYGLVKAAANTGEVALVAVAARDGGKAAHYAGKHGIAASYCGYQRLLDQPDIDAVYLPLSNHVHEEWAIKALQAQLDWGNGMTGAIHSSIWSRSLVKISLHVQG